MSKDKATTELARIAKAAVNDPNFDWGRTIEIVEDQDDTFTFEDTRIIRSLIKDIRLSVRERQAIQRLYRTYQSGL